VRLRGRRVPPRVLLTGFPPFSTHEQNVSQIVLEMVAERGIEGLDVETMLLSVDEAGSRSVAEMISDGSRFDAIVHLGLADKRQHISLERYACNTLDFTEVDNSGRIESGEVVEGAQEVHQTTTSIHVLDEEFDADEQVVWSTDAGGYVCNETYFRTLNAIHSSSATASDGRNLPALFIHLPAPEHIPLDSQFEIVCRAAQAIASKPRLEVVGALLFDETGRILTCRRPPEDAWGGWWEFPGGKVDKGEKQEEALARELLEELGINVIPIAKTAELSHDYEDRTVDLHIWDCGVIDPISVEPTEHDQVRWLSRENLADVKWLPADEPLILRWIESGIPQS
jgi:8-oxo-dGTP diphosphatase